MAASNPICYPLFIAAVLLPSENARLPWSVFPLAMRLHAQRHSGHEKIKPSCSP